MSKARIASNSPPPPRTQVDSMIEERLYHSSSLISGEVWLVSGGTDGVAWRDTTEFWRDGRFQEGPRWGELLPEWMFILVSVLLQTLGAARVPLPGIFN